MTRARARESAYDGQIGFRRHEGRDRNRIARDKCRGQRKAFPFRSAPVGAECP